MESNEFLKYMLKQGNLTRDDNDDTESSEGKVSITDSGIGYEDKHDMRHVTHIKRRSSHEASLDHMVLQGCESRRSSGPFVETLSNLDEEISEIEEDEKSSLDNADSYKNNLKHVRVEIHDDSENSDYERI